MFRSTFRAVLSAFLLVIFASCATEQPVTAGAKDGLAGRITVLYDAFGNDVRMQKDWGYAALVELGGKRILFDTGNDPAIFARNVAAKNVDLGRLDFVVLSHRHADHMGGLTHLLKVNPSVEIYAPKEAFGMFGSDLPSKFYRRNEALPAAMRYYGGAPPDTLQFGSAFPGANIHLIDKTTQIMPGITLIALVSDTPGTKELKELSLAVDTPAGLVVVVGCAHPGIENVLAEAVKIDPHIHLVAGGFHLVVAQDPVIDKVTTALNATLNVDLVAPGHCTGEPTFAALQKAFGERYRYAGVGTAIAIGISPSQRTQQPPNHDFGEADRTIYRALLAKTED